MKEFYIESDLFVQPENRTELDVLFEKVADCFKETLRPDLMVEGNNCLYYDDVCKLCEMIGYNVAFYTELYGDLAMICITKLDVGNIEGRGYNNLLSMAHDIYFTNKGMVLCWY